MSGVSRRAILRATPAVATVAAMPALAAPDALQTAIERHRAAWLAFSDACDRTDTIAVEEKGGTVTAQDEAHEDATNDAEIEALSDLCAIPCTTLADNARKAAHLLTTAAVADCVMQEADMKALLRSIAGSVQ